MVDAVSMATQLAAWEVYPFETRAQTQLSELSAKRSALSSVNSTLSAFDTALSSLSGYNKSVIKNSASSSDEDFLTASADSSAQAGNYQIFVEQLAQRHQLATQLPGGTTQDSFVPASGTITLGIGGESFILDLAAADTEGKGELSYLDLVSAINRSADNPGISASLVRSNGGIQLLFSSDEPGLANELSISSVSADPDFDSVMNTANMTELLKNQDAIAWIGAQGSGLKLQNSTNEFEDVIDGVNFTLNKVHESGDAGINLSIAADQEGTKEVMEGLVTKYNSVMSAIAKHSANGNDDGETRGALASDPTTRSIQNSLRRVFQQTFDGVTTSELGFEFSRDGTLSFNSDDFEEFQSTSTVDIEALFNGEGMLISQLQDQLEVYNDTSTGTIKRQIESIDLQKSRADDKLAALDIKYENYYTRYLKQYTSLTALQSQMDNISSMFTQY